MANLKKQTFPVLNMHCAGCANNVEKTVRKLVGITDASVNFASNTLSVTIFTKSSPSLIIGQRIPLDTVPTLLSISISPLVVFCAAARDSAGTTFLL